MKHRLLAVLLSCALLLLPLPARAEEVAPVVITDTAGLLAMANQPEGSYLLGTDLDMRGVDWIPFAFSGEFDGGGHTLYNLTLAQTGEETRITYDGRHRGYHTVFAALFSSVSGSVTNLRLINIKADLSTDQPCFLAGIAGYLAKGTIENCGVSGRLKITSTAKQCGAAGIAGFGRGRIDGCTVDAEITMITIHPDHYCEEYLGGVLANGFADVENCKVKLAGFTSVRGYVHNGGLVGLSDVNPEDKRYFGVVRGCTVDAVISFFEDVEDRRAYCSAYVGERQNDDLVVAGNETTRFESRESKDFSSILLPDSAEHAAYDAVVTPPSCETLGYTTYTNPETGYTYTDDYTAPAHTPQWRELVPATYDRAGVRQQYCAVCGEVFGEEPIPVLIPCASCVLDEGNLSLYVRDTFQLSAAVLPDNAADRGVIWSSADASIARVDESGLVTAVKEGTTMIHCKTDDGFASASCAVEVSLTPAQWITRNLLFGWLWAR